MQPEYSYASATRATSIIQQAFSWMFGGLLLTSATAFAASADPGFQHVLASFPIVPLLMVFAELGIVWFISRNIQQMSHATAVGAFLLYSALNGVSFSWIFSVYTSTSITGAFLSTALIFGVMALYGFATKRDLSSIGSLAIMVIVGLIIAGIVNMFLHSGALAFALSCITIIIFSGLTAFDTQKLKVLSTQILGDNLGIFGALSLYLDFINIFFALLQIFGGNGNRNNN